MKLALLSDIHANLQAFEACLADARARGATQFAFLGDLVGYGADPAPVVERVMAMAAAGAWVLKGNHDVLACHPPAVASDALGEMTATPPAVASDALGEMTASWTHAQLSAAQRKFLDELPLLHRDGSTLLVHASVDSPERWHYVYDGRGAGESLAAATDLAADIRHVFGGHVHRQMLYYQGQGRGLLEFVPTPGAAIPVPAHRRWVATIGSVGQPRDGRQEAMYALFDRDAARLTFARVAYDHAAAAAAIRAAGLPEFFAERLSRGQ